MLKNVALNDKMLKNKDLNIHEVGSKYPGLQDWI